MDRTEKKRRWLPILSSTRRQVRVHGVLQWKRHPAYRRKRAKASTIGKIEAFHKAYTIEASIYPTHKEFVNYWNYERPHQGIGYHYPADVYFRDLRDTS